MSTVTITRIPAASSTLFASVFRFWLSHRRVLFVAKAQRSLMPLADLRTVSAIGLSVPRIPRSMSGGIISHPSGRTSHFVATIDKIILGTPTEVSLSPSKARFNKRFLKPEPIPTTGTKRKAGSSAAEAGPSRRHRGRN
ncbi:hypothetical protein CTheo_8925 [Ceratobasidium theobromae]|uniref:Uncharacterized protein n=1 Tax=Ceratobasidium theobromae TaxID=1582974 RepID=A0A5N5Q896_9AGAM|nr:hypothetical protein CTheo_8925 [Ceratobasidium theobromae]